MPEKINFTKEELIVILTDMSRGYGEGKMMTSSEAVRVAETLLTNFFIVPLAGLPTTLIDVRTLEAPENKTYPTDHKITAHDDNEYRYFNILAAVSDYLALEEIQKLEEERIKQMKADTDLAFMLMKASDPAYLKYVSFNHVPRDLQNSWLGVARKAREELAK